MNVEHRTSNSVEPASRAQRLWFRARVVQAIRAFFIGRDYLEVETPHRIPVPIPETHIDPVPSEGWWLHTSPELCLKRLLAAGHSKLFQVCRCFRAGERGRLHLPEFTMLEWYRVGVDYRALMDEAEALIRAVDAELSLGGRVSFRGRSASLAAPWERLAVREAFRRYADTAADDAVAAGTFDEILTARVEPHLGCERPVFLVDYPAPLAALARRKRGDPSLAERFELYLAGLELANGFSELADAEEQRGRFEADRAARRRAGKADGGSPERFLRDLERMPEAAGIALGVDRLVMLLAGVESIDEVVAFAPEEL